MLCKPLFIVHGRVKAFLKAILQYKNKVPPLQFNSYFGSNNIGNTNLLAKVGIKSCRYATECVSFVHAWMQLFNQLELCLHEQTQIVANAACRVGSQEFHRWIASLPLVSLLFIVIPTPF